MPSDFETITNSLSDPSLLITADSVITFANSAAKRKFSFDLAKQETRLGSLTLADDAKLDELIQMWASSKSPLPGRITFKLKDGDNISKMECLCKGNLVRPRTKDQPALIMVRCIDKQASNQSFTALNDKIEQLSKQVRVRRLVQEEISQLNKGLEEKVEARTKELELTNATLQNSLDELERAQSQIVRTERLASLGGMVAGVAHEINTPVGVCVTAASYQEEQVKHFRALYDDNALTRSDFESFLNVTSESSGIILANLDRAAELVRSFKQLAVDQTSDESREIHLKSHIKELLSSLKPYFRDNLHRHEFNCSDDIKIHCYPGSIAQVISNLVGNSIIHGFEGIKEGLIKIDVVKTKTGIKIHYSDNGNGIPKKNHKKIFDPFFTTKRNQGGTGLGMNIVYNVVTSKLFGDIKLNNDKAQGAHFDMTLPFTIPKTNSATSSN